MIRKQKLKLSDGEYEFTVLSTNKCKYEILLPKSYTIIYIGNSGFELLPNDDINDDPIDRGTNTILVINHNPKSFFDFHIEGDEMKSAKDAYAHTIYNCVAIALLLNDKKIEGINVYHNCDELNEKFGFLNVFQLIKEDLDRDVCILEKEYKYDI